MKKKLFALSGVFLIVLVIAGLWATRATDLYGAEQTYPAEISPAAGLSMQQMVEGASSIVIGTCIETRSQWVERRLVTLATISVSESLKGDPGGTLMVEIPGGIDAKRKFKVAMTYAGAPQISPTEKVLLFLNRPDDGSSNYSVMGFAQGKFSIGQANDGEEVVMPDMNRTQVQKGGGAIRGNLQVVSLSEFKERVRSYLNK